MTPKRFFFIMLSIFILSMLGGGSMLYFANQLLQKRSSNVVGLKLESAEVEAQLSAYQAAKKDVEKYAYLNKIVTSALPQDKDQARSVREIFLMAQSVGITIKSVQFSTSTLGVRAGASPSATTTVTTPSAASSATSITQAKPVDGLKGVYSIETIVTPYADNSTYKVTYNQLISFLEKIESNRRAMQVADIELKPLGTNASSGISFTLTLNIFIKP
jgi:hypothetical protein